jgi:diadenosine tetraphosphate (Ap4A) HIT family hydrolase
MFGQNYQKEKLNQVLKKRVVGIKIMAKIYDEDNVFAKKLMDQIPYEKVLGNKYALAFNDINPQAPIHILVIPKNPYTDLYNFTQNANIDEIKCFWDLVNDIITKKSIEDKGFRIITNSGKDGNQDVPHFHVHILGGSNLGRMIN